MIQGVSFSSASITQGAQKKPGNKPPQAFLDALKDAGVPEDIIAQGRAAVEEYAKANNITLPNPPAPPVGNEPQGEQLAPISRNAFGDKVKELLEANGVASTGNLEGDVAAIKTLIQSLPKTEKDALKEQFELAKLFKGPDKAQDPNAGTNYLADMNKFLLLQNNASA